MSKTKLPGKKNEAQINTGDNESNVITVKVSVVGQA